METISDFGTVDYFAIETLTLGVFNVWLGMNSLSGAAQISSILFFIVVILLTLELIARRNQRFYEKHSRQETIDLDKISNYQKILFFITCLIPLILGFIIPVSVLLNFVLKGYSVVNISEVVDSRFSLEVLDGDQNIVYKVDGLDFEWTAWYEPYARDWYWKGPEIG